jgi:hypothetical protein
MSDVTVPYTGWGRGTWDQLAWGEGSITNAGAQGLVGSVEITADAGFSVGGLPATGQVSPVTVNAEVDATPEGVAGTGVVGDATAEANVEGGDRSSASKWTDWLYNSSSGGRCRCFWGNGNRFCWLIGYHCRSKCFCTRCACHRQVDAVSVNAESDASVTGVSASGLVNDVQIVAESDIDVTGVLQVVLSDR